MDSVIGRTDEKLLGNKTACHLPLSAVSTSNPIAIKHWRTSYDPVIGFQPTWFFCVTCAHDTAISISFKTVATIQITAHLWAFLRFRHWNQIGVFSLLISRVIYEFYKLKRAMYKIDDGNYIYIDRKKLFTNIHVFDSRGRFLYQKMTPISKH